MKNIKKEKRNIVLLCSKNLFQVLGLKMKKKRIFPKYGRWKILRSIAKHLAAGKYPKVGFARDQIPQMLGCRVQNIYRMCFRKTFGVLCFEETFTKVTRLTDKHTTPPSHPTRFMKINEIYFQIIYWLFLLLTFFCYVQSANLAG